MSKHLKRIFNLQVSLFIVSIFIVSLISFFISSNRDLNTLLTAEFDYELQLFSNQFSHKVQIAEEKVKSLSSRTAIREVLYNQYLGEISLDDLRLFTQDKYSDGASVFENLLYARRTDLHGNIIAETLNVSPGKEILSDEDIFIFREGERINVFLRNRIEHDNEVIGYDEAAFFLEVFNNQDSDLVRDVDIKKTRIANSRIKEYSNSYFIEGTESFLYGELKQSVLATRKKQLIQSVLIQAIFLILFIIIISFFTIFRQVHDLVAQLKYSQEQIVMQERYSAVGQITAGLSHEFNNIFAVILGYSDILIKMEDLNIERRSYLEHIITSGKRASTLVHQLSDFCLESIPDRQKTNLFEFISSYKESRIVQDHHQIEYIIQSDSSDCIIEIAAFQLKQVLDNVIQNAVESTSGQGIIRVVAERVETDGSEICTRCSHGIQGTWGCLSVLDEGPGMDKELIHKAYEPFFTTKDTNKGLGLSQASGIVKHHSGHLTIVSTPGEGCSVQIYIPIFSE